MRRATTGSASVLALILLVIAAYIGPDAPIAKIDGGPRYVLALSWQPAFCEGNERKRECKSMTGGRFDATHLSIHGLWPQPGTNVYCGVSQELIAADKQGRWRDIPEPRISLATRDALELMMPGTQSLLDRHEWIKHGTCYRGGDAEAYFFDTARLAADINKSPAQGFLAANIGRRVSTAAIRSAFDEAFGPGVGERVRVACDDDDGRQLVVELTIGLRGDISAGTPVSALILASNPTDPGCPGGIIDPVGLQ
jgi:ribonuclease T2